MRESWDIGLLEFSCYNESEIRINRKKMNRLLRIFLFLPSCQHSNIPLFQMLTENLGEAHD